MAKYLKKPCLNFENCVVLYISILEVYYTKTKGFVKTPAKNAGSIRKIQKKDNWQLFTLTIPGLIVLARFWF